MLELWGGVECTVNRVEDEYLDQLAMSGHDQREDDLILFAGLGLKTLRFPILWEHLAPESLDSIDWNWADERLTEARRLGLRVIVGFVHHGSGPRYTSLLDPGFPKKLATLAGAFAQRYPWVEAYTPVNEPLTTARFSGLYGCWYPHARDNKSFLRMLWHECHAVRLAMESIRRINPKAQLIQTEDLGKVFSTTFLSYQAEFENNRRWLSLDLLTGKINPDHELYSFCRKHGLSAEELQSFAEQPCRPDILGINHYITSNRFLDERLERYPAHVHGGNGHHRYADIEAVRVGAEIIVGPKELLKEAWDRYRLPLAVTEVHLGCTREEQMRWFQEIWNAAKSLRSEGVNVKAITVWSLLGGFDWNSLVTKRTGYYESGVFDLRSKAPRPTAIAAMIRAYASEGEFDHPVLDNHGWWHRPDRLLYPSVNLDINAPRRGSFQFTPLRNRELLITGAPGNLAAALAYICERRGLAHRLIARKDLDLSKADAVRSFLKDARPWAVINAAGYGHIDKAEEDEDSCFRDNVLAPMHLAESCADAAIKFMSFSSDLVFGGDRKRPYTENDPTDPLGTYGRSKVLAEKEVLARYNPSLLVRTSPYFGPWDESNFLTQALRSIARGKRFYAPNDLVVSPTYLPDLVDASLDLLLDGERGVWHVANKGVIDWASFGRMAAKNSGMNTSLIVGRSIHEFGLAASRPSFSALASVKAQLLPDLERSVDSYIRECRVALR